MLPDEKALVFFSRLKDIIRLFKKGSVYSKTTSFIFQIAPSIYFASVIMAIMVIPLGEYKGIISFEGDFVFFAYILGVGKFFNIISALDTGSSFEGMGASREALFSMFAEPAFFILMGSFAFAYRSYFFPGNFCITAFWFLYIVYSWGIGHCCFGYDHDG